MVSRKQFVIEVCRGVFRYPYHQGVKYLTLYSRVLKNLRICVIYPKICMFFIQINRFSLLSKEILTRNPNSLTDNQYGPRKSRVVICSINTPLEV